MVTWYRRILELQEDKARALLDRPRVRADKWIKGGAMAAILALTLLTSFAAVSELGRAALLVAMLALFFVGARAGPFSQREAWGFQTRIAFDEFEVEAIRRASRFSYRLLTFLIFLCGWLPVALSGSIAGPALPAMSWTSLLMGSAFVFTLLPGFVAELTVPIGRDADR